MLNNCVLFCDVSEAFDIFLTKNYYINWLAWCPCDYSWVVKPDTLYYTDGVESDRMDVNKLHAWWSAQARVCNFASDERARTRCFVCGWSHQGLTVGILSLRYSVVYTVDPPCLCFISFLYLDLYLLGDNTSIS